MISVTYSNLRESLKSMFDLASRDHEQILVTRKSGENMVILSESDYNSIRETSYLLRSPKNAQRLFESLKATDKGDTREVDLSFFDDE